MFETLRSAGQQIAMTSEPSQGTKLEQRLEEINERWGQLMTKSAEIR